VILWLLLNSAHVFRRAQNSLAGDRLHRAADDRLAQSEPGRLRPAWPIAFLIWVRRTPTVLAVTQFPKLFGVGYGSFFRAIVERSRLSPQRGHNRASLGANGMRN
jgi:hypothetical protein